MGKGYGMGRPVSHLEHRGVWEPDRDLIMVWFQRYNLHRVDRCGYLFHDALNQRAVPFAKGVFFGLFGWLDRFVGMLDWYKIETDIEALALFRARHDLPDMKGRYGIDHYDDRRLLDLIEMTRQLQSPETPGLVKLNGNALEVIGPPCYYCRFMGCTSRIPYK